MLTVQDVVVAQSKRAAAVLDRISLTVKRGEKVAILGPSGAGKTTLFRAISGFLPIRSGTITVNGITVNGLRGRQLRALRQSIGMVSQRHDLVDRLKVYENVMAGALGRWSTLHALRFLVHPLNSELAEAERALDKVGLARKLRSRTSELSGGEHQRVAIARALVQQPLVLLADEPIASLDPVLSGQILDLLCGLAHENGFTLICSLHQPEFAYEYFDRVIKMTEGNIESDVIPLYRAPLRHLGVGA
ncbi:MAG TPA: ATP-binding cassette domain-containing protein [Candidatus Angelobacter sp.]|jgi:phosphonate transport system ATP-binding protein|nr:ATP-binding cassette domain-containing protein [Candidatus Angelobacter sp.]